MTLPKRPHAPPEIAVRPCREPDTMLLVLRGVVERSDVPRLALRLWALLEENDAGRILCDVADIGEPDAATVDALARLRLAARRGGREVRLLHAARELEDLLALVGLDEVLPPCKDVSGGPGDGRTPDP